MDKVSYALGLSIGNNFLNSGIKDLQIEDFVKGLSDVLKEEKPEITYDEAKQVINDYFLKLQREKLEINKKAGEEFLNINKGRAGVVELPSGLQYQVLKQGTGEKPKATDKVKCHYHGTLINGTVFDCIWCKPSDSGLGGSIAADARRLKVASFHSFSIGLWRTWGRRDD